MKIEQARAAAKAAPTASEERRQYFLCATWLEAGREVDAQRALNTARALTQQRQQGGEIPPYQLG